MKQIHDVIIAGAGCSGVITAARLHELAPDWSIALVDKEVRPGGRLLSSSRHENVWTLGLNTMSPALCEWLDQALKANPDADDLPGFVRGQRRRLGVLSAGDISEVTIDDVLDKKAGRAIAGAAAARDWSLVDELVARAQEGKKTDQPLGQSWGGTRKSPSAIALEHLARLWGIPDMWTVSNEVILQRAQEFQQTIMIGDWDQALSAVLSRAIDSQFLQTFFETRILGADYQDDVWTLATTKGSLQGKRLVVAQNPWDALLWLPKNHWPSRLVTIPGKAKPSSAVLLTDEITTASEKEIPDVILIPAENVQVIVEQGKSICFQATLTFELTLQAPAVVKAVKRLRRARKKLMAVYPDLQLEGDHLALVPVAWSQPIAPADRRMLEKLEIDKHQASHLVFCGDAYGPALHAEQNLMSSVRSACESLRKN
ncbi:MAG: FAD-dependent oxidoreductase [Oligoflexus sp.]